MPQITPLTDDDIMPWGEYHGELMSDVPAEYLLEIADKPWINKWPAVWMYIEKEKEWLIAEVKQLKKF